MSSGQSLWELCEKQNLSRRHFLKICGALTSMLGLSPIMLPEVIARAKSKPLVPVIWLHGHGCTGCSESFLRSKEPTVAEMVVSMISLEYHELLSAASGHTLEEQRQTVIKEFSGKYLVVAEGAVPFSDGGYSCSIGGVAYVDVLKEVGNKAAAILAVGTCASWGGIQAAGSNPTEAVPVHQVITTKPVINIPGCPPIPEILAKIIMNYSLFDKLPTVDSQRRPIQFFGNTVHDTCYRRPFYEAEQFAERYDDAGSKAGWCLYKLGCRGPTTFNSCASLGWWQRLSYPIRSGSPCIGCSTKNFWDEDPFTNVLEE